LRDLYETAVFPAYQEGSPKPFHDAVNDAVLFIRTDRGTGTGFFITQDGYAITCNHVVEDVKEIETRIRIKGQKGGDFWRGCTVLCALPDVDLALIRVEGENYPFLRVASPEREIPVGEKFMIFGYPFGIDETINTFEGRIASDAAYPDKNGIDRYDINSEAKSGNSGSPLVSETDGYVIGVLLGSQLSRSENLTEEINYIRPAKYIWAEFTE
jgi:S1-C subfamily serine protease